VKARPLVAEEKATRGPVAWVSAVSQALFPNTPQWLSQAMLSVIGLSVILRTIHLGYPSLWNDEIAEACVRDHAWTSPEPRRTKELTQAADSLVQAIRIRPNVIYLYDYLGSIYDSLLQWEKTVRLGRRVFRVPADSHYWGAINIAVAYENLGDKRKALSTIQWALERENNPDYRRDLAERAARYSREIGQN